MFETQFMVIGIVGRCDFEATGSKGGIHIRVGDNRYFFANQWNANRLPHQMAVAFIIGVNTDRGICHDGFGADGRHRQGGIAPHHLITDINHFGGNFLENHFVIGQGRLAQRVPIHHAGTPVDQAFMVELNKGIHHRSAEFGTHGKGFPVPVQRGPQFAQLTQDNAPVFLFPRPGMFQKGFPSQALFVQALFGQLLNHLGFGCNRSMVGTGNPASIFALHAGFADQHILDRIVEHMPQMQDTGHIGGGGDHGISIAIVRFAAKTPALGPSLVPTVLKAPWLVLFGFVHG